MPFIFWLGILVVVAAGFGTFYFVRKRQENKLRDALGFTLFLIKVPHATAQSQGGAAPDFKSEIHLSEQLISNLATTHQPFVFEIAVPHVGEEIHFYLAVPRSVAESAVRQVQSLWAGASVTPAPDDYTIFNPGGAVSAAYLTQKENPIIPLRTYQDLNADPFAAIVGALSKVNEVGEGVAMQVVVRPADSDWKKKIEHAVRALQKGEPLEKVLPRGPFAFEDIKDAFQPPTKEEKQEKRVVDSELVKIFESKANKPLFEVNVRLLASAETPRVADEILESLAAGFQQLASPRRNQLRVVKARNPKDLVYRYTFRTFAGKESMLLNSEEIASLYHLPTASTATPKVKWLKSKEAPPPANLPQQGTYLGDSHFQGVAKKIYLTDEDRRRHLYLIGQTGTGKSTLLGNLILEDIESGRGVAVIDPHGELVESALGHVPKERADDVIYFDPGDMWRPVGLNMLDYNFDRPEEKTFIVNEMQSIFTKLFPPESMGPMFEQYMRNALLLLMEDMPNEPATLVEVPRIFTDPEFRRRKLARIHNPVVVDFWEKEAIKAGGEASLANMTPYITSKFNNFISNDYLRPIIGQPKSAFNFREAMDSGKIILINLAKGRIGDINAGLLGMIFTGKLLLAALSRTDIADADKRRDFNLYIDEFQNFTTDSISTILSEARKYRLNLTMAHQFIGQLTDKIRDAVFGNVGSEVVFRIGVQDAEFLVKQFEPTFDKNDLMNVDNLHAYAKILIHGQTSPPFSLQVGNESWAKGDLNERDLLKEYSRTKYGADRQTVEDGIHERLRN